MADLGELPGDPALAAAAAADPEEATGARPLEASLGGWLENGGVGPGAGDPGDFLKP